MTEPLLDFEQGACPDGRLARSSGRGTHLIRVETAPAAAFFMSLLLLGPTNVFKSFWSACCLIVLTAAGLSGCGGSNKPSVAKVEGVVTYKGEVIPNAVVMFHGEGSPVIATGKTNAAGEYSLTSFAQDDGCIIGPCTVTIEVPAPKEESSADEQLAEAASSGDRAAIQRLEQMKMEKASQASMGKKKPKFISPIPVKYSQLKTTDLLRTVEPGVLNRFDFVLTE